LLKINPIFFLKAKLISFLLVIIGNKKASEAFSEMSELLHHMASKNKLTKFFLLNKLFSDFRKIESLGEIF